MLSTHFFKNIQCHLYSSNIHVSLEDMVLSKIGTPKKNQCKQLRFQAAKGKGVKPSSAASLDESYGNSMGSST